MRRAALAVAAFSLLASLGATEAQAQNRGRVGVLSCSVSGGIGLIVTSQKTTLCTFNPRRGPNERYVGSIRRFGLDIGATRGGILTWAVFSRGSVAPGSLAGSYVGGGAEATAGAGVGANVLVGGSNRSISLQPVSVGGQTGLNFALGVADFELRRAR
ncbi:DUF992 domain-containing protein [Microvirga sp. 3-52]|jgi:hypothetical protein|uniref:DUF992 domain-containing protein n=1 Tax=Microvirga sp. 3-52 TaxID=2792425 RepID=UPI001AC7BED9|nr:DUF992 domain-containing protein [Microvirga sp. 3-52]MBO1903629.1 DUF992 domain-containing protein [Microvirga sp. 3-52]MBS7450779.1 DUF992 domain-containing protein [Microvirga sp. 3-52]